MCCLVGLQVLEELRQCVYALVACQQVSGTFRCLSAGQCCLSLPVSRSVLPFIACQQVSATFCCLSRSAAFCCLLAGGCGLLLYGSRWMLPFIAA